LPAIAAFGISRKPIACSAWAWRLLTRSKQPICAADPLFARGLERKEAQAPCDRMLVVSTCRPPCRELWLERCLASTEAEVRYQR
jgi:hypothetical protein